MLKSFVIFLTRNIIKHKAICRYWSLLHAQCTVPYTLVRLKFVMCQFWTIYLILDNKIQHSCMHFCCVWTLNCVEINQGKTNIELFFLLIEKFWFCNTSWISQHLNTFPWYNQFIIIIIIIMSSWLLFGKETQFWFLTQDTMIWWVRESTNHQLQII